MNIFGYTCPACGAVYQDLVEKAKSKLVHSGLISSSDGAKLPTEDCIRSHSYVRYEPCGHCCPDVFAECSACEQGYEGALRRPGRPSQSECQCHYCIEVVSANARADLHTQLKDSFNREEIRMICFNLRIDYENFPDTLDGLARELILYCERANRIVELLDVCRRERPELSWQW